MKREVLPTRNYRLECISIAVAIAAISVWLTGCDPPMPFPPDARPLNGNVFTCKRDGGYETVWCYGGDTMILSGYQCGRGAVDPNGLVLAPGCTYVCPSDPAVCTTLNGCYCTD